MTSAKILGLVAAVVMVAAGALFTFQGLGYVGGSSMTGSSTWAVLGPLIAGLGVALGIVVLGGGRRG
ncbi:MAG TPA: hypothetical protein VFJ89_14795 [Nocardioides sp.]|nr:hypothetical protein [Nocardioides sp.]